MAAVRSVEPLSTTITRSTSGDCPTRSARTPGKLPASFRAGIRTATRMAAGKPSAGRCQQDDAAARSAAGYCDQMDEQGAMGVVVRSLVADRAVRLLLAEARGPAERTRTVH